MLVLARRVVDEVIRHAREEHPLEACGIIAGKIQPVRVVRMENDEESDTRFTFNGPEQLRVWKDVEIRGERIHVVYHSHTGRDAYPSDMDRRYLWMAGMEVIHLIAGTNDPLTTEFRAYRFLPDMDTQGRCTVEEVELRIDQEALAA